jgi:hypothetical protein
LWFNLGGNATAIPLNSRLFEIANSSDGDGNRLYFALNNGTNLQFGVNQANTGVITVPGPSPFGAYGENFAGGSMTNIWLFVAASYSGDSGGTVNLYTGTMASYPSLVYTLTGVGDIAWDASGDYANIGNRSKGDRTLPGLIDDVRLYVQIPEPTALAIGILGAMGLVTIRRRS